MAAECDRIVARLVLSRRDAEEAYGQEVHAWIAQWMTAHTTEQCDAHDILTRRGDGCYATDADRPDLVTRLRLLRLLAEDWEVWLQRPTASAGTIR
eukprot:1756639-Lingulodinium_polyedra.AAC.1